MSRHRPGSPVAAFTHAGRPFIGHPAAVLLLLLLQRPPSRPHTCPQGQSSGSVQQPACKMHLPLHSFLPAGQLVPGGCSVLRRDLRHLLLTQVSSLVQSLLLLHGQGWADGRQLLPQRF